jgi:hypothetical protein
VRKLIALAALAIMAVAASCETENIGGLPVFFSITGVDPLGAITAGQTVTITAHVAGAPGPYNVSWNFGGGATPNTVTVNGQNGQTTSTTVVVGPPGTYTGSVTVTSGTLTAGPINFTYTVGIPPNITPVINSATFNAGPRTITVDVSDADAGDTLTVNMTGAPAGVTVTPASVAIASNAGVATFNVSADDVITGGTGNVTFTVTDNSGTANNTSAVSTVVVTIPPIVIPADTLVATPLSATAATGEAVTVLVLTGVPANPFQYLVGCGLTIESDADYVSEANNAGNASFNVGAVGGAKGAADGIWAAMKGGAGPGGGFLLAPDNFIQASDIGGGRERWDFNITPLQGAGDTPTTNNLTTASGALFNAQFKFTAAGTKTFGFQEVAGVKRTYYADEATEYFWGDITNDGSVVPNSVTIN